MTDPTPVAVCSRSFSRHPVLRAEILERFSDVRFNDEGLSLAGDSLVEFLSGRERAITALEPIGEDEVAQLPELRLISKVGVGLDMIDQDALARHDVALRWHPGTNRRSVAELVLAFAIALLRHVPRAAADLRDGKWGQPQGRTLSDRIVGIVGFGHVGQDVAGLLEPFGCSVLVCDVRPIAPDKLAGVEQVELDELLVRAEVVTLHVTLTAETKGLLDRRRLELLGPDGILINTARGGLVDEVALKELLREGRIAGAALDVFATEPPGDPELLELPSFIGTPHIGGSTDAAILAMGRAAIAGLCGPGENGGQVS